MKGTHGTCADYAEKIKTDGFQISPGRAGNGAYFWSYTSSEMEYFARELAESWWCFASDKGRYDGVSDNSCIVIYVELDASNGFLDLELDEMKDRLIQFTNKVFLRVHDKKKGWITRAYDLFVAMLEKEMGRSFDIIRVRVAPPPKKYYEPPVPMEITGAPSCYVVKNLECINPVKF